VFLTSRCKNSRSTLGWCISWSADEDEQPVGNIHHTRYSQVTVVVVAHGRIGYLVQVFTLPLVLLLYIERVI